MIVGVVLILILLAMAVCGLTGWCADTRDPTFSLWPLTGLAGDDPRATPTPRPRRTPTGCLADDLRRPPSDRHDPRTTAFVAVGDRRD